MWELFAHEYLVDGNGTQAAIRAGASPRSAHATASRWLKMDKVSRIIEAAKARTIAKIEARYEVTQERVLLEMARLAYYNPQDYFDEYGKPIPIQHLPRDLAAAVVSVDHRTVGKKTQTVYKLANKEGALAKLGQHLNMFKERHVIEGDIENPISAIIRRATPINKMLPSQRLDAQEQATEH